MPKESTLRSMVLCLSLVCLVCSALLGGVYVMTKGKIDQEQITNDGGERRKGSRGISGP